MKNNFIAKASIEINAPLSKVWDALINPAIIKKYLFDTNVISDWKEGSNITWKGEWQGKAYEDKGKILQIIPGKKLQYTYFSSLSGVPDVQENYNTITVDLSEEKSTVRVTLSQDNNATEESKEHSEKNWEMILTTMKNLLEK